MEIKKVYNEHGMRMWTPEEDAFILENYETMSKHELGEALQRPFASVRARCSTLGAVRHILTNTDKGNIRKLIWDGHNKKEVAESLGLNYRLVLAFCRKDNLKRHR